MKQLHDQYRDQVTFVDIVVRQAHPAGQRVPGSDLGDDRRRVLLAGVPHHGMGHRSGRECPGTPTERLRPGRPDRDRSPARWTACGLAPDPDARLFNVGSSAAGDRRLSPSGPHSGSAAMMASAHCGICRAGVLGEMHPPPVGLDHPLRPFGAQPAAPQRLLAPAGPCSRRRRRPDASAGRGRSAPRARPVRPDQSSDAATEAGLSRIYAGVHTRTDHDAGYVLGALSPAEHQEYQRHLRN